MARAPIGKQGRKTKNKAAPSITMPKAVDPDPATTRTGAADKPPATATATGRRQRGWRAPIVPPPRDRAAAPRSAPRGAAASSAVGIGVGTRAKVTAAAGPGVRFLGAAISDY